MNLYYNYDNSCFSLSDQGNCKKVFESHTREGWKNKEVIEEGRFCLEIIPNFYPKSHKREFLSANLYVDGVHLLPVSQSFRIPIKGRYFDLHEIAFTQYGAGNNADKMPKTVLFKDILDWNKLLESICQISEQPEEWQRREFRLLLDALKGEFEIFPSFVGKLLKIYAPYEELLNYDLYPLLKSPCVEAMQLLIENMNNNQNKNGNFPSLLKHKDYIWHCLKYNLLYAKQ